MNTSDNKWIWLKANNPLIISSSGGGGHLTAALSLIEQYQQQQKILPYHTAQKPSQDYFSYESLLEYLMLVSHLPLVRELLKNIGQIELPSLADLKHEYAQLIQQQTQNPYRQYIDFLLDWMPNGYYMTALFNLLQRQNHGYTLSAIVKNQTFIDRLYKKTIAQRVSQLLVHAAEKQKPYDMIISTQALGIPALCHAVARYNLNTMKKNLSLPIINIHQFITDIPHQYATHYLNPMQDLEYLEKNFLHIHLLNIDDEVCFIPQKHAKNIWRYEADENPMIRPSLHHAPPPLPYGIHIVHTAKASIMILPKERLASIMLSSASGQITIDYLKSLIDLDIEHIALIGRHNQDMRDKINALDKKNSKIYLLGQLSAATLGVVLQNSHLIIVKAGGLSLMELASFTFDKSSVICLHQEQQHQDNAGLVWEEGNKEWFLKYCKNKQQHILLSNPENIKQHYLTL